MHLQPDHAVLTHQNARLSLLPTPQGYTLSLDACQNGIWNTVASSHQPLSIFYRCENNLTGIYGGEPTVFGTFETAECRYQCLTAQGKMTDSQGNDWNVALNARPMASDAEDPSVTRYGGFSVTYTWTLLSEQAKGVFLAHPLSLHMDKDDTYVLYPGTVYDSNNFSPSYNIPRICPEQNETLYTPSVSFSLPVASFLDRSSGRALYYGTPQGTAMGNSGFFFRKHGKHPWSEITMVCPEYRNTRYAFAQFDEYVSPGGNVCAGEAMQVTVYYVPAMLPSVPALFRKLSMMRDVFHADFRHTDKLPFSEAAAMVEYNNNRFHWLESGPFYCNATMPDKPVSSLNEGHPADWMLVNGWCSGPISAYALLTVGTEQTKDRARSMLDLIADTGLSPSGLFYTLYTTEEWTEGGGKYIPEYRQMRTTADGVFFMARAYLLEQARGRPHRNWLSAVLSNCDAFVTLWDRYGEFGHYVDRETGTILEGGSAAGALCIADLALAYSMTQKPVYLRVAEEAAENYFVRFVATGHSTGGPLDVYMGSDSESVMQFLESYVTMFEVTGDTRYLAYADTTADLLASWVVGFPGSFPKGTTLDRLGIEPLGGIIANVKNHHVGPGTATNSASGLWRLYRYTGIQRHLRLLEDIARGLPQAVSQYDGYMGTLKKGMMTEQINLTNALNPMGEIWEVSASWSQNNVLMTYGELPAVYVDRNRRITAIFDHLQARTDFDRGTVTITNATGFTSRFRVFVDGMMSDQGTGVLWQLDESLAQKQEVQVSAGVHVCELLSGESITLVLD